MNDAQVRQLIREELSRFIKTDRFLFERHLQLMDGRNIQLGKTTGTMIGTETTQKVGFFGTTPVAQQTLTDVAGGGGDSDGTARTKINAIIDVLQTFGFLS